jgi:deoxyribose-phosphate aldolase
LTKLNIASYIDHTLLKAEVKEEQIIKLCEEARNYKFASVCVNPYNVKKASELLHGTEVKVCTVVGFPLGASTKEIKAAEASQAILEGAQEIDMVLNIGALKSRKLDEVEQDILSVVQACKDRAIVKVIIETCLLTEDEKITACQLSKAAGADFVKTSTGFSTGGATIEDISLMRKTVGPEMGVKASGGVRDLKTALEMIQAGATRIGASSSVEIVLGMQSNSDY